MTTAYTYVSGLTGSVTLKWTNCITCGVPIAMPSSMFDERKDDHRSFWCPNGHSQHFVGESEEQRLRRELSWARNNAERIRLERDAEARSKAAIKGHLTRIKKRIASGVCPACNRHFQNVHRHMKGQHPEFVADFGRKSGAND